MNVIDLKACFILERLGIEIPGAEVEYECEGGTHWFAIAHGPRSYRVAFPDQLLGACSASEIDRAVRLSVERIRSGAAPRLISVGARAGDRRPAV